MGQYIVRPSHFRCQRDFVRHTLCRVWPQIIRVRVSKANKKNSSNIFKWCDENIVGRWSRADGADFYYFENTADAVYFRLRWTGTTSEMEQIGE